MSETNEEMKYIKSKTNEKMKPNKQKNTQSTNYLIFYMAKLPYGQLVMQRKCLWQKRLQQRCLWRKYRTGNPLPPHFCMALSSFRSQSKHHLLREACPGQQILLFSLPSNFITLLCTIDFIAPTAL